MKSLVILILLFIIQRVFGQSIELSPVVLYNNYSFHGTINGNLEIYMSLDENSAYTYDDKGCIIACPSHILGSYRYAKHHKPITLIGKADGLVDSIVLYEMDDNFNKTAFFKGVLNKNEFSGIWSSLKKSQQFSFRLTNERKNYGHILVTSNNCRTILNHIDIPSGQGDFKLLATNFKENKTYVLLETSEPCCGAYNCRGTGCGGGNTYLRLYILNKDCSIIENKEEIISSGCEWIEQKDRTDEKDFLKLKVTNGVSGTPVSYNISVDKKNLDKGIVKEKIE
jgi:hypothetical protein